MRAAVLLAGAALAACQPAPVMDAPAAGAQAAGGIQLGLSWEAGEDAGRSVLMMRGPDGRPQLQLACASGSTPMTLSVPGFRAIGSEERLSFGVDDEVFVFVAGVAGASGVEGTSAFSEDLLLGLGRANAVSASYGAQRLGPHIPPDPDTARRFAAACRRSAGRG